VRQASRVSSTLTRSQSESQALAKKIQELQHELESMKPLQEESEKMKAAQASLTSDRDNLLSQVKLMQDDTKTAVAERDVLKRVLKRTSQEGRELRTQVAGVGEINRQLEELRLAHQETLNERDSLEGEVAALKSNAPEKRLKEVLDREKAQSKQQNAELAKAKQQLKDLEARQQKAMAKIETDGKRYTDLNEHYAQILAENTSMKHQVKKVPVAVARMAQQHERLLKETATMHYNMGVLFSQNKQYYQAAQEFAKVIELHPDDADTHYNLGVIYSEHLPDRPRAVEHFRKYLELNPKAQDASWVKQYIASWQAWEAKERLE